MSIEGVKRHFPSRGRLITLSGALILLLFLPILPVFAPPQSLAQAQADFISVAQSPVDTAQLPFIQDNSLLPLTSHYLPEPIIQVIETIPVILTAYSSDPAQTDDTPFITASGTRTRDGVVASNLLPFGTQIRIPALFGAKIFTVEDRLNSRIGDFQIDVWFPSAWQARQFGVKDTYIETIR